MNRLQEELDFIWKDEEPIEITVRDKKVSLSIPSFNKYILSERKVLGLLLKRCKDSGGNVEKAELPGLSRIYTSYIESWPVENDIYLVNRTGIVTKDKLKIYKVTRMSYINLTNSVYIQSLDIDTGVKKDTHTNWSYLDIDQIVIVGKSALKDLLYSFIEGRENKEAQEINRLEDLVVKYKHLLEKTQRECAERTKSFVNLRNKLENKYRVNEKWINC